jgi:hypothetical protein
MEHRLRIFISSTADLKRWRRAAAEALTELHIDGQRFEQWPSSPKKPISECLQSVEESDALLLLLGKKYGTVVQSGLSATHLE